MTKYLPYSSIKKIYNIYNQWSTFQDLLSNLVLTLQLLLGSLQMDNTQLHKNLCLLELAYLVIKSGSFSYS